MISMEYDVVIVGGGMVGLSIAHQLLERGKTTKICILEKEIELGKHSSGRNSGVLHAGIYYKPSSLKAKVCISGSRRLKSWISEKKLSINNCGKLIIPQRAELDSQLDFLAERGKQNEAVVQMIDNNQIKQIAPFASSKTGRGLWSPNTSVCNPKEILLTLEKELIERNVHIFKGVLIDEVNQIEKKIKLNNSNYVHYGYLYNSAGLHADKVAKKFKVGSNYKLIPFRGSYWQLRKDSPFDVKTNLYPVPDLNMPFLGVHFTPTWDSKTITIGPTATFAFGRENYEFHKEIEPLSAINNFSILVNQYLSDSNGMRKYFNEQAFLSFKSLMIKNAKQLIPSLESGHVVASKKVGIRPQLFNLEKQKLEDDFVCIVKDSSTHVLNAISPAFTASFSLADLIIDKSKI